jgi:cellulose synthase/poly-beta-1,6-N-acetylglucosamine synthase-like glycosyltransferase
MMLLLIIFLLTFVAYLALSWYLAKGLAIVEKQENHLKDHLDLQANAALALVVVQRNDLNALNQMILSLNRNLEHHSSFKLVVVDDHSDAEQKDRLKECLSNFNGSAQLIFSEALPGKKQALKFALNQVREDWIVQTDADCVLAPQFMEQFNHAIKSKQASIYLGLVRMIPSNGFWSRFAALDFLSLQMSGLALAALGKAIMGNAAAIAYRRVDWLEHAQYGENWKSGDDTFFIQALAQKNPAAVQVWPKAQCSTMAPANFLSFIRQRLRWGGKAVAYRQPTAIAVSLTVGLFSFSLVISLGLAFFNPLFLLFSLAFVVKIIIDYRLLRSFARYSDQEKLLQHYGLSGLTYPFYVSLIMLLALTGVKAKWR